jgi:NAD(P)-dependent dehydrogenase (short-subunit alcohol dehydrogenase family)
MTNLKGRKALITGGSRGIGRATAVLFAQARAEVAIDYLRQSHAAQEIRKKISKLGRKCTIIKANISLMEEVNEMVDGLIKKWG